MPELLSFCFPEGRFFFNWYNTELNWSSKIIFFMFENGNAGRFGVNGLRTAEAE